MINLPAATAAPAPSPAANAGLPPPAANAAASADANASAGTASADADGAVAKLASALLGTAAASAPAPFGAVLDAIADAVAASDEKPSAPDASPDDGAAAAAAATMLPAMGNLPLAGIPGATPGSVAAVAAALTGAANTAPAGDSGLLLRQQLQASALAARDAAAETNKAPQTAALDANAALLANAARAPAAAVQQSARQAVMPAAAPGARSADSDALSAALGALQGQAADSTAAPIAAKDGASLLADSQQRQPADAGALPSFRSVLANIGSGQSGDALHLSGSPEQWQQPLRAALGDRLQLQLARNDERAVIRLEPPNMGSVEISVRHSGGALQVNIAASHSEVLRQLNTIGDAVRQDLSQRQLGEVAVTVSSSNARSLADGGQQQRQQEREQQRQPGRALDDADAGTTTFAMFGERE